MKQFIQNVKDAWYVLRKGRFALVCLHNHEIAKAEALKKPTLYRYFLAGPQSTRLWRGEFTEGETSMTMQEFTLNPYTDKMAWCGSYFGEWDEDKAYGVREISSRDAALEFPGSVPSELPKLKLVK